MMRKKKTWFWIVLFWMGLQSGAAGAASLAEGFGKARWGMSEEDVLSNYGITLKPPERSDPGGVWAVSGPAEGELTVSGEALGEPEVRSVSFGIHPRWGLAIIHVRFNDTNDPGALDILLPKWTARFGPPKERKPGPKVIWEDAESHVELTYHTVSPRHPTPSDHLAIVLWSIPLMDKIEAEEREHRLPDVEMLAPMPAPHKEN